MNFVKNVINNLELICNDVLKLFAVVFENNPEEYIRRNNKPTAIGYPFINGCWALKCFFLRQLVSVDGK